MPVHKLKSLDDMIRIRQEMREQGRKLVFTNGCFDILHLGHIRYLNAARELGDCLAVAINSDRSVRQIKGENRPVIPELERAEILGALACVDVVLIFDEPTPQSMIDAILPDILVKGADWGGYIVGRETVERNGGQVLSLPVVQGCSTTDIIRTVLDRFAGPAGGSPAAC
jgi:rfaE bifunctional protein nucleotidyltransferase chain/domain